MEACNQTCLESPLLMTLVIILVVWELVWKFIAMWKAAKKDQLAWFICIAIFNTVGILPIIYLLKDKCYKKYKTL
jgi:predicted permease